MRLLFAAVMLLVLIGLAFLGYYRVPGVAGGSGIDPQFQTSAFLEILSFVLTAAFIGPLTAEFVERRQDAKWQSARQGARERLNDALKQVVEAHRLYILTTITPISTPRVDPAHEMKVLIQQLDRFLDIYDEEHPVFDPEMHSAGSPVRRRLAELLNTMRVTHSIANPERSARVMIGLSSLATLRTLFGKADTDPGGAPANASDLTIDARVRVYESHVLPVFEPVDLAEMRDHWRRFLAAAPRAKRPLNPIDERTLQSTEAQEAAYRAWLTLFAEDNDAVQHMLTPIDPLAAPAA